MSFQLCDALRDALRGVNLVLTQLNFHRTAKPTTNPADLTDLDQTPAEIDWFQKESILREQHDLLRRQVLEYSKEVDLYSNF